MQPGPLFDGAHQLGTEAENLLGITEDNLAGIREDVRAAAAPEKRFAQRFFQFLDLFRDRGLGDVQLLCGLLETAFLRHDPKVPEVMIIQPFHAAQIIRLNLRVNEKLCIRGRPGPDLSCRNERFRH